MHRLLKPKNINRFGVALALFAPIVYLFGTQFMALAGAHGEELLAETTEVTPSYDELMTPENFSYGAFDWENEYGRRFGFSLGYIDSYGGEGYCTLDCSLFGVGLRVTGLDMYDRGLGFAGDDYSNFLSCEWDIVSGDTDSFYLDDASFTYSSVYIAFYAFSLSDPNYLCAYVVTINQLGSKVYHEFYWNSSTLVWSDNTNTSGITDTPVAFDDTQIYFDDGAHLPAGVEFDDTLASYFVPSVKSVETTSYRNALFGNLFGNSNFLTDWGSDVLSDSPHGFVPFATFFRFIDNNMLHLGSLNIGLMGYGYIYYCAHVLIFDLVLYMAVFFLRFIKSVVDRWEVSR